MRKQFNALVALAVAFVVGLTLAAAGGTSAMALKVKPKPSTAPTPTLTVHKYTTPADSTEGDGAMKPPTSSDAKPVAGVEYTVYKIKDIDLNKNGDWETAAQLQKTFEANPSKDTLKDKIDEPHAMKMTTGTDGSAKFTFDKGTKGLYLVVESSIAGAKVDNKPTNVVGSKPFLVAVPMTDRSTHDKWNYDVHVYPKNAPVTATKTVNDANTRKVGDYATFTITTDIPAQTGTKLNKYAVLDHLNPAQYEYHNVAVKIEGENDMLAENTDYTLNTDNGFVKVELNSTGLGKLEEHRGGKLVTTLVATVKAVNSSNGEYANTAYVVPSDDYSETPGGEPGKPGKDGKLPPIPSNAVNEKFAKIVVNKAGTDGKKLAGAEFELYSCTSADQLGSKLTIAGTSTFKTAGEKGTVTIDAVRLSDFYNGQTQDTHHKYCLKEVKAPEGYELLPKPIELDVTAEHVTNGIYTVDVKDVPYNAGFHLPLTGSNAAILLGVVGVLLLAGGVILVVRKRQRA